MFSIVPWDKGTSAAPNTPWISRNSTISYSDVAIPHSIEATVNPMIDTRYRFFCPKRADSQPTGAVMIAAATM